MNIEGATATTPVTAADLVSALVGKQTPTFENITGLDQLKEVLNTATNSAATGRDAALQSSGDLAKSAMDYAYKNSVLQQAMENIKKDEQEESKPEKEKPTDEKPAKENEQSIDMEKLRSVLNQLLSASGKEVSTEELFQKLTGDALPQGVAKQVADKLASGSFEELKSVLNYIL